MGVLAGEVGGALWVPLLIALLLALLTAGSYAELVTKYPKAGGAAIFAERAFRRPLVSFIVGSCMLAAVGFMLGSGAGNVSRVTEFPDGSVPAIVILSGAIIAYYSFVGFETSANVADDCDHGPGTQQGSFVTSIRHADTLLCFRTIATWCSRFHGI